MAQAVIQLPPDSTGKMVAARSYTEGANTVYAQAGYIATDAALQTASLTASAQSATFTGLGTATGNLTITVHGTYGFTTTPPTYILEGSDDTGTTWYPISAVREETGFQEQTGTLAANTSRSWQVCVPGYDQIRFRLTAWGTPTGTISVRAVPGGILYEPSASATPVLGSRTNFTLSASNFTAATTEALITCTPTREFVNGSTGTSFTVTTGKRMILTGWTLGVINAGAAVQSCAVFLRVNPTGAVTTSSPVVAALAAGTPVATTSAGASAQTDFAQGGIELWGAYQLGISQKGTATAGNYVTLYGYEI